MKHYAVTIKKFISGAVELVEVPANTASNKTEAEKIALAEFFERNNIRGLKKLLYRASSIFTEHLKIDDANIRNLEEWEKL